jgi:general secretion pathway protein A
MIFRHFNLREQPFGVTPDPKYIFASAVHREALSSILYGVQAGLGFIALTGPPGTGKTTILFEAMRRLSETHRIAFLFQTVSTPADLLRALLIELGVKSAKGSLAEMQAQLNEILVSQFAEGKPLVVAIDEAQNLNHSVLEAVRMLSNFETASHKLMQIILIGQPQLAEKLSSPSMLQLRQRISIFGTLRPLTAGETEAYIRHRVCIAGSQSTTPLFTKSAARMIAHYSAGIPRNINNICFNALSSGYVLGRRQIDSNIIQEVVADLRMGRPDAPPSAQDDVFHKKCVPSEVTRRPVKAKRVIFRSLSKIAACAIFLSLLWLTPQGLQTTYADDKASPFPTQRLTPRPVKPTPSLAPQIKIIKVRKGQTLSEICVESFGQCGRAKLHTIIEMNSVIHAPNHIEVGQRIYVPISSSESAKVDRSSSERAAIRAPGEANP